MLGFIILAFLQALLPVLAHEDSLFTSSLTYCSVPDILMIQEFDFKFFKNNASIAFTLSATNLAANLNASVNIIVNTYGSTPLNYTFNICDVLQGQLCPLPQYNVTGSLSLPLPSGVELPIPDIAFQIPDLEAVAQVTLRRVETGETAVCLQSTLSNGWSLHITSVAVATGTVALISLISSIIHSFFYPQSSAAVFRAITTLSYFQHIALTGMLHLNFPLTYIAFVTNFAWSFGLFSHSDTIQSAIERMRAGTGSSLSEEAQAPNAYADRTLSPYNLVSKVSHDKSFDIGTFIGGTEAQPPALSHSFITPAVVTSNGETLNPGIPVYVNYVNIATGNAFMSMFFTLLFLFIAFGLLHLVIFGCLKMAIKHNRRNADVKLAEFRSVFTSNAIRLAQLCLLPAILLSLFQWTLRDSWLSTLISVIIFLGMMSAMGYPTFLIIRDVLAKGPMCLDEDEVQKSPQGTLIAPYNAKYYFFLVAILAPIIRAAFVSLAQADGFIQVVGLVTLELLYLILLLVIRPFRNRRGDVFEVTIAILRLVSTAGLLPFVKEKLDVDAIPRVAIGIGVAIVLSVGVVLISFNVLAHLLPWRWAWHTLRGNKKGPSSEQSTVADSQLEKGAVCVPPSPVAEEEVAPKPIAKD